MRMYDGDYPEFPISTSERRRATASRKRTQKKKREEAYIHLTEKELKTKLSETQKEIIKLIHEPKLKSKFIKKETDTLIAINEVLIKKLARAKRAQRREQSER